MVGLFSRTPKDPQTKQNVTKIKELKKLVKEKKYSEAIKSRTEYLRKVPHNHDVLFTVDRIYYLKNKYRLTI